MAGRIGLKSLASLSKQTSISLRSGLTLSRAIPLLARESRDRRLRRTLREVYKDIESGETFSDAISSRQGSFPSIFVEMVKAGEHSGHLVEVFSLMADYFDKRLMLRRATIRASIYPLIQLSMAYAVFVLILILFAPNKEAMVEIIIFYTLMAVAALVLIYLFLVRTRIGRAVWDHLVLSIPVIRSATIKLCMARFTRAFAMQIESAIPMTEALERSAMVTGNGAVERNLRRMIEPIRQGESLAEAVSKSRMVTPMIREVIAVAEETGNYSEAFNRVAGIYEDESMVVLESLPKFIGPVVLIFVGIIVVYLFYVVWYVHYLKPALDAAGI